MHNILEEKPTLDYSDDLEPCLMTHCEAFDRLRIDICDRLGKDLHFEVTLILEIMKRAALDLSKEYFYGHQFKYHCYLIGLDADSVLKQVGISGLLRDKISTVSKRRIADSKIGEIREKYATGKYRIGDLVKEYQVSEKRIAEMVKGLPCSYRPPRPESFKDEVIALRKERTPMKVIARHFKADISTITDILKPLGLNKPYPRKKRLWTA